MPVVHVNGMKKAYAYEKITTITSSTGLTSTNYTVNRTTNPVFDSVIKPDEAYITVEDGDLRCTFDGTTPTVSSGTGAGHLFGHGDTITLTGLENIQKFRAINAVAANGAVLRVTYFSLK